MSDIRFEVKKYLDLGWKVLPIKPREKRPRDTGWQVLDYQPGDFAPDDNIGVRLGTTGLYDIDLDVPEASVAAQVLLPRTGRISGRASKPSSHFFYSCTTSLQHEVYRDTDNKTLLELRGVNEKGEPPQTVIPPSTHATGEPITWAQEGACPTVDGDGLRMGVRYVAVATLVARHFPPVGSRHDARLALAGFLGRAGVPDIYVMEIVRAVTRIIGGPEGDAVETARATLGKLKKDANAVTGGPRLAELLTDGTKVLSKLNSFLGREDLAATDDWIDRINQDHFIIEAGTTVVVADGSGPEIKLWPFGEFKKKYCKDFLPSKKGRGLNVADVWIEHPKGRKQRQLIYAPPGSDIRVGPGDHNGWRGFSAQPSDTKSWAKNRDHIKDVICAGNDEVFAWVLDWCAALIQQPGLHGTSALVMRGGQGTGKGHFAHTLLGRLFDRRHYVHITDRGQFYGRFNDLLSGRCLVFLDEATWGGDKRDAGILKGRITEDELTIERKHLPALTERSMIHIIMASNEDWPVGVDRDDRRFCALDVSPHRVGDRAYWKALHDEIALGAHSAMIHELLLRTVDWDALRQPPATEGLKTLKTLSLEPDQQWWLDVLTEGRLLPQHQDWQVEVGQSELHDAYIKAMQELGIQRRRFSSHFKDILRGLVPGLVTRKPHGARRLWVFPDLDVCRRAFEERLRVHVNWDTGDLLSNLGSPGTGDDVPF